MKILELRFKNLNSLYGEWVIDFNSPEYVSNGIFALTGPTGAGKSTILDAICLALYGSTPRLGKITKSGNEIMSRQSGECYAEVLFESQAGCFRCHWEQRRARKRAEGKLQDQEHQIADGITGIPIETKKSLVAGIIEEKTGMDFDRFTRSILLAQGGFDTFLKADAEQKSRILEQITGTKIYSEISRRVHLRQRDEREALNLLLAEISGIMILEPEQESKIQQELEAGQKQAAELAFKSVETGKAIAWLINIDALKKELSSLTAEKVQLHGAIDAFKPERVNLDRANKAASLDGVFATLSAIRKQHSDDQVAFKAQRAALPELESTALKQSESLKAAEQQTLQAKEGFKVAAPLIQKIRLLDQKLAEQKESVTRGHASCVEAAKKIDKDKQARIHQQTKRSKAEKTLVTVEQYCEDHAQDEWLISGLAGIEEQCNNLIARQKEIIQREADLTKADKALIKAATKLAKSSAQCEIRRQGLEDATKNLEQGRGGLKKLLGDKLLREYRAQKESLLREIAYLRKIEELEDYRSKLEDDKPCPLCGSKKHPFAEGNIPVPDALEQQIELLSDLISKAEDQEAFIKKLEERLAAAHKNLNESEKFETNAANEKKTVERALAELKVGLTKLRDDFGQLKLAVSQKLEPLGITEIAESEVSKLLVNLKARLSAWLEQVKLKTEIESQIATIDSEIKRLDAVIETQSMTLTEKQQTLKLLEGEYSAGMDERKGLYGDKKPDKEEIRLSAAVADAEDAEKRIRALNTELQQELMTAKSNLESLEKRIEQRETELKKTEIDFVSALKPAGFADEKHYLDARLTIQEREALSERAKQLDDAATDLAARQKDRDTRLATESAKKITDSTLDELEPQFKEYEDSLKELRDEIAARKHRLNENTAARERIKAKKNAVEAQKKECHRWEKLHGLIGSADGKKYRNFAQGLTFELMVSHANRQLEKMTDRYLLVRDDAQPLELNVVDNYQGGEIRSTKNLSGGESFIVSLTLALGLSKMASRKVRVDSLFLDEGFGTLDDEVLETALETLGGLQQDGKLIGIISHVSALKERISTLITIEPISGGRSSMVGPGCMQLIKGE